MAEATFPIRLHALSQVGRHLDTPLARAAAHFLEMLVAMYVGMALLGLQVDGLAAALGVTDLAARQPGLATALMALEMTIPMALWMDYRGHGRRAVAEMAAAMIAPALVLIIVVPGDPMGPYHPAMLVAMVAVVVLGRGHLHVGATRHDRDKRVDRGFQPGPGRASSRKRRA